MNREFQAGWWGALIGRLTDQVADPGRIALLQERLSRHGAELQGQLPDLLLRTPDGEAAIRSWLADKDLSHWIPQVDGGSAADGWQFETAAWNRARGAEAMDPFAIGRTHLDGGLDALGAQGVPESLATEALEAAVLSAAITLALFLLQHRNDWERGDPEQRRKLLRQALKSSGAGLLRGAGLSLVLSLGLALVPGGQAWLVGVSILSLTRAFPGGQGDPFSLQGRRKSLSTVT